MSAQNDRVLAEVIVCEALRIQSTPKAIDFVLDEMDKYLLANPDEQTQRYTLTPYSKSVILAIFTSLTEHILDLPLSVYMSALAISYPWRDELNPERGEMAKQLYQRAESEKDKAYAESLLKNLI